MIKIRGRYNDYSEVLPYCERKRLSIDNVAAQ
jgi:hypothetical protein